MSSAASKKGIGLVEVILATGILALASVCVLSVLAPAIRASERVNAHGYALDAVLALRQQSEANDVFYYEVASGVLSTEAHVKSLRITCVLDAEVESGHHYQAEVYQGNILLYATRVFF